MKHLPMLLSCALSTGCASMAFAPSATYFGAPKSAAETVERAQQLTAEEASDVDVRVGQLPEGISVGPGGSLQVDDSARYEIIGSVKSTGTGGDFFVMGFYPYIEGEGWRKAFCYWQVPLTWITFTTWAFVSPLHYPCKVGASSSPAEVEERKQRIIDSLRRTTKAMGGDLLIVTSIGATKLVRAGTAEVIDTTEATGGEGVALRVK